MNRQVISAGLIGPALLLITAGCSSPLGLPDAESAAHPLPTRPEERRTVVLPFSATPVSETSAEVIKVELGPEATPDDFVRYALVHNPGIDAAYQRWRAASERLPQVGALPDPRLNFGYFLEEIQTRTGPQEARVGISQSFPWPGLLESREDAAARAARGAWQRFEAARLAVVERVVATMHDLAYLDAAIRITQDNLELLVSFEEIVRARYRVAAGSHPELVRVQVELGQLEDRLAGLRALRPAYVAELNATLNRQSAAEVAPLGTLPARIVTADGTALLAMAQQSNPTLLALDEHIEEQRALESVARKQGLPELSVGLDYIFTGQAMNRDTPGSGDDPVMLNFGITLPLWRDKYDAGVREAIARRLATAHDRADETNRLGAAIERALFEHTDAHRRVRLYEQTLIPKAEESLRASLAGFRAGDTSFLDLLDTERSLLEFAVASERARADRGKALARLYTLVGAELPTRPIEHVPQPQSPDEVQP